MLAVTFVFIRWRVAFGSSHAPLLAHGWGSCRSNSRPGIERSWTKSSQGGWHEADIGRIADARSITGTCRAGLGSDHRHRPNAWQDRLAEHGHRPPCVRLAE